jgi:hypothetical protein
MEYQKRPRWTRTLEPDEVEQVLMDDESDEELEEADKLMCSPPKGNIEEIEFAFRARRAG